GPAPAPSSTRAPAAAMARRGPTPGAVAAQALAGKVTWVVWENGASGERGLWRLVNGVHDGGYTLLHPEPIDPAWHIAAVGDLNGDGEADIVWQDIATGECGIWPMTGGTWSGVHIPLYVVPEAWRIAAVGDFTGDVQADIVWQNVVTGERGVWPMDGTTWTGSYIPLYDDYVPTQWQIASAADLNGDAHADLVWQNTVTGERGAWLMNRWNLQQYVPLYSSNVPIEWQVAATGDLDGDGDFDLLWQNAGTGERGVWVMDGVSFTGQYHLLYPEPVPTAWQIRGVLEQVVYSFTGVDAGYEHSCAVTVQGVTACWGGDYNTQLGDSVRLTMQLSPRRVAGNLRFATIALGDEHSCALSVSGPAFCWGYNAWGQGGNGTLATWSTWPAQVVAAPAFSAIAPGGNHTCALAASGGVAWCWGMGQHGQLGDNLFYASLGRHTPAVVYGSPSFLRVTSGLEHSCGIGSGGAASCWGLNSQGQLGDASTTNRAVPTPVTGGLTFSRISAGGLHSCGLTSTGQAWCWGDDSTSALGDDATSDANAPVLVAGGHAFSEISAGRFFTCALTADGTAWCWGANDVGQLGDGSYTQRAHPVQVAGTMHFTAIAAGGRHACSLGTDRQVYCWGANDFGQLGDGTTTTRNAPGPVLFH
ncbi:MAG TPA: hypothetical protein VGD77_15185, partial [Gemmatimonadaceae bacterium]